MASKRISELSRRERDTIRKESRAVDKLNGEIDRARSEGKSTESLRREREKAQASLVNTSAKALGFKGEITPKTFEKAPDPNTPQGKQMIDLIKEQTETSKKILEDTAKSVSEKIGKDGQLGEKTKESLLSKFGPTALAWFAKFAVFVGLGIGGYFLLKNIAEGMTGCYLMSTKKALPSTKVSCTQVQCNCAAEPCKSGCVGAQMCCTNENGYFYFWKEFTIWDAFVQGLQNIVDVGTGTLDRLGEWFKSYGLYVALVLGGLFLLFIIYKSILTYLETKHLREMKELEQQPARAISSTSYEPDAEIVDFEPSRRAESRRAESRRAESRRAESSTSYEPDAEIMNSASSELKFNMLSKKVKKRSRILSMMDRK